MSAHAMQDLKDAAVKRDRQRKPRRLQAVAGGRADAAPTSRLPAVRRTVFAVSLILTVAIAVTALSRFVLTTFAVANVHINGELHNRQAAQIQQALTPYLQRDLFTVDLDGACDALEALPWLRQAQLRRQWPDTIVVSIDEHIPVAYWNEKHLLSSGGEVFEQNYAAEPENLPHLSGPEGHEAAVLERYAVLSRLLAGSALDVAVLRQDQRGSWFMQTADGIGIYLGRKDFELRLHRLLAVLKNNTGPELEQIALIDLRHSNGFAVSRRPDTAGGKG